MDNFEVSDEELECLKKEIKGKMMGEKLVYAFQHLDSKKNNRRSDSWKYERRYG